MKLKEFNFRDLDKKIILLNDKNLISNTDITIPYYGIIYIDHNNGISLRIVNDNNNSYIVGEGYIFRYKDIENIDIEFKDNINDKNLIDMWVNNYYKDEDIIKTRDLKQLDKFRLESNPDIINITFTKDNKEEKVWSKIIGYTDEGIVCSLINNCKLYKLDKSTTVVVNYDEDKNIVEVIGRIDL